MCQPIPEHLKPVSGGDLRHRDGSKVPQIILVNIQSTDQQVVLNKGGEVPILKQ